MKNLYSAQDIAEGISGAGLMGVHILLHPLLHRYRTQWGTTEEEANATLPGDEWARDSKLRMTWGITINAPIEDVWPWVVQMGQGRGGSTPTNSWRISLAARFSMLTEYCLNTSKFPLPKACLWPRICP